MAPRVRKATDNAGRGPDIPASTPTKTSSESRKLRNRLSQKAFRARQAMRIKELEERLDTDPVSDATLTAQLRDRNATLRNQLLDCHKKITSLQISMYALVDSTALALGLDSSEDSQLRRCSHCQHPNDSEDRHTSPDEGYSSRTSRHDFEPPEEEPYGQAETSLDDMQIPEADCTLNGSIHTTSELGLLREPQEEITHALKDHSTLSSGRQERLQSSPSDLDISALSSALSNRFITLPQGENREMLESCGNTSFTAIPQCPSFYFNDMGIAHYADLASRSQLVSPHSQMGLRRTNSLFSDHLNAVEYFLQQKWLKRCPSTFDEGQFMESVKFMLSSFVSVSWQVMTAWHTYTKAHIPLKDLTAWRVTQTQEAYMKIIPSYRPTRLQMSTQHPAIIDWIPWSTLRDKLILYHSANPGLDNVICDIGNSYVVPCDLSKLVAGLPAMIGYVSVWDLVRAIAPDVTCLGSNLSDYSSGESSMGYFTASDGMCAYDADAVQIIVDDVDDDQMSSSNISLPAPDKATLFSSKALAIQAFRALGMNKGAATFFLDPEFFGRHPELYDPQCDIMARGVPLRPNTHISIPVPRELNSSVLGQYRELTRWAFDHTPDS